MGNVKFSASFSLFFFFFNFPSHKCSRLYTVSVFFCFIFFPSLFHLAILIGIPDCWLHTFSVPQSYCRWRFRFFPFFFCFFFFVSFSIYSSKLLCTQSFSLVHKIFALHCIWFSRLGTVNSHTVAQICKRAKAWCKSILSNKGCDKLELRRYKTIFVRESEKEISSETFRWAQHGVQCECVNVFVYWNLDYLYTACSIKTNAFAGIVHFFFALCIFFCPFFVCWCCSLSFNSLSLQGSAYNCFIFLSSSQRNLPWMFSHSQREERTIANRLNGGKWNAKSKTHR